MKKPICNILVCGLLRSGSSALVDLLSEYDNIYVIPNEFDDFRAPGLVADQLSSSQDTAFPNEIKRVTNLSSKLWQIYNILPMFGFKLRTFKGITSRAKSAKLRLKQLSLLEKLNTYISSDIPLSEKIKHANQWISGIGSMELTNQEYVVFNQPLHSTLNTQIWPKVFDPWKLIIVYRDPKDQLADIIKNKILYAPYGAPSMSFSGVTLESIYGRSRKSALAFHREAIKKRYEWIETLKKELSQDKFLLLDFEGLIRNYDNYKTTIENFLGVLKSHHTKQKKYFDPSNAQESIGIYQRYLSYDEIKPLSELDDMYNSMIMSNTLGQSSH